MPSSLPPSAQARLDRLGGRRARTSLLEASGAAALQAVGLDPVGDVLGASVRQLSRTAVTPVRTNYYSVTSPRVILSTGRWSPYSSYARTMQEGWNAVLSRMRTEARALHADGIVGIRLQQDRIDDVLHEFIGMGTAVRARSVTRPGTVFTTGLAPSGVAALMLAGWVPVEEHVAVELGVRAEDFRTSNQLSRLNGGFNVEVGAYSDLTRAVRASARRKLAGRIAHSGADGGLLTGSQFRMWSSGEYESAQATLFGSAIARFGPPSGPGGAAVLPLDIGKRRS